MKKIYLYLLLILLSLKTYAQEEPQRYNFLRNFPNAPKSSKIKQKGLQLALDRTTLSTLYRGEPEQFIFDLPRPNGKTKSYVLKKHQVVTSTFKVTTSDGREFSGKDFTGVSYKVFDRKNERSFGGLTVTKDDIGGLLQGDGNDNINIGKLRTAKDTYVALPESEMGSTKPSFDCATPDPPLNVDESEWLRQVQPQIGNTPAPEVEQAVGGSGCKTIGIYIECDYRMYQENGSSVANTTAKVTSLFNLVKQIYENEGISIYVDQVFVWTTQDPYASISPISSLNILNDFTVRRQGITQKLGHLLGTNFGFLGGIAWIDVVCNPAYYNNRFGYSNIYNTFNTDINIQSWSVYCVAHELGHNFGSKHTHWCGWPKAGGGTGRIDSCYAGEAIFGVGCGTVVKPTKGTIMSYCHTTSLGVDLMKGFGPLPGDKIRTGSSCLSGNAIPYIKVTTPRRFYSAGETLPLRTTTVGGATYSWTGPNGFTSSSQSPNINTLTTSNKGLYSVTATQTGCLSNAAKIRIRVNPLLNIPQTETFSTWTATNYSNWEFKGPQALSDLNTNYNGTNVQSFWRNSKTYLTTTYNALYHEIGSASSFLQDTAFSPVYTNNNLSSLNLSFKLAHALGLSSSARYDSLEVLAYFSGKTIPVRIYKKGGTTLRTTTVLNTTSYKPASDISSDWRIETVDLSLYDTCKNVQFAFVFKPTQLTTSPSNNIFINTITIDGTDSPTALKTPSISVDSSNNLDKNYTLTTTIPSTHNATSYQVLQGTTVIASGNLANNNATTITTARTNVANGTYTHTATLSNGTQTKTSGSVSVVVNYNLPILTGTLSADSTTNRDKNYALSFVIPQNHNATSYQILEGTNVIGSGNLTDNNGTTITLNRTNITNGTYTHTAKLLNSTRTPNNTTTNSVSVVVNYIPPILTGTLSVDSTTNRDQNYTLSFAIPQNHNATSYQILQGTTVISSGNLANNNSITITASRTNITNGTYTHTAKLFNSTNNTTSNSITVNVVKLLTGTLSADSTTNRDKNYTLSFSIPQNHSATSYQILEGGTVIGSGNLTNNNATTITLNRTNISNGTYTHTARLINSSQTTISNSVSVNVFFNLPVILIGTLSADSTTNNDQSYILTFSIPQNHNATSYQILQGASVIGSGNLANNNDTIITLTRTSVSSGTYTHTARLSNGTQTTISNVVTVNVNDPPILTGTLSVDSTSNRDPNYVLSFSIPQNHNATSYQILQGTSIVGSGNLTNNNSTTITLSRLSIPNGTYTHTTKLLNSSKTPNNTTSNSINVAVNYNPVISLAVPTVIADSLVNLDQNYIITFNTPSNHNATAYEIKEGSTIVKSSPLTNNNSFTTTFSVTNKPNGSYEYTGVLKNGIYNSISLPINVIVNYNPSSQTSACTTNTITSSDRRRTNFTYSFTLNNGCSSTGYRVLFYNSNTANGFSQSDSTLSQTQVARLSWQPTGGSVRNAGQSNGNISFTQNEINTSLFSRIASPLPSYSNRWYRIDVICTSCTQTVKTKTAYFFVK
jgi:hypothetical protein